MSRFKVGDRVRRISNREQRLEVSNIDMSDGTFYAAAENLWYFQHDFELVSPPQPVESPDDWVEITDPNHVPRVGVDWFEGLGQVWEVQASHHAAYTVGYFANVSGGHKHYCRRRDYPQKPAEVHTGGPYVASSEYERVCGDADCSFAFGGNMAESVADKIGRLRSMADERQMTWDLSEKDQAAIRLALDVIAVIECADHCGGYLETGPCESGETCLVVGPKEVDAANHLECFLAAAQTVK